MSDNVLSLVKKESAPNYVKVVYRNGDTEERECDFLGMAEAIPGFLYIGKDSDTSDDHFINLDTVLKINTFTSTKEEVNG